MGEAPRPLRRNWACPHAHWWWGLWGGGCLTHRRGHLHQCGATPSPSPLPFTLSPPPPSSCRPRFVPHLLPSLYLRHSPPPPPPVPLARRPGRMLPRNEPGKWAAAARRGSTASPPPLLCSRCCSHHGDLPSASAQAVAVAATAINLYAGPRRIEGSERVSLERQARELDSVTSPGRRHGRRHPAGARA